MTDEVKRVARAIWREDHYDPKLCGHGGEYGLITCAYCESHDDDTPDDWPADKERVERQARAAIAALTPTGEQGMLSDEEGLRELGLLYNCKINDDTPQFTRWQMIVAINHGIRLASLTTPEHPSIKDRV